MKVKPTLIILFFWNISNLFGQDHKEINDILKILITKDFVEFKKHADSLSKIHIGHRAEWKSLRDLSDEFQEAVFIFEEKVPEINDPSLLKTYSFRINIISSSSKIIYYNLSEQKYNKHNFFWVTIDSYKNDTSFEHLKLTFKNIFKSDLYEKDLFVIDFIYGSNCGLERENPKGRIQIDKWVKQKNKNALLKWLKSANTEKQVYAIDGLYQMKSKLRDEEIKIVKFICSKKGKMYVCNGCVHSRQLISYVTNKIIQPVSENENNDEYFDENE